MEPERKTVASPAPMAGPRAGRLSAIGAMIGSSPVQQRQRQTFDHLLGGLQPLSPLPSHGGVAQRTVWVWSGSEWKKKTGDTSPYTPKPDRRGGWHEEVDTAVAPPAANTTTTTKETEGEAAEGDDLIARHKKRERERKKEEKKVALAEATPYDRLLAYKKDNEHIFLRGLFGTFEVGGWSFPAQKSGDGIMGTNTISASRHVTVDGATDDAALHINFMIGAGTFAKGADVGSGTLTLTLTALHMTARSKKNQDAIPTEGASILTAAKSIHCGPGNDWNWSGANVPSLLVDLGLSGGSAPLQRAIRRYGQDYIAGFRDRLKRAMSDAATGNQVTLTFVNGDSTWG